MWSTASLVLSVPIHTFGRQGVLQYSVGAELGPSVAGNKLSCSEEWGCGYLGDCQTRLLLHPQGGPSKASVIDAPPPHPDTLESWHI